MSKFLTPIVPDQMNFTGERYVTTESGEIEFEHYHRYLFAAQLCTGKKVLDVASGEGYGSELISQIAESVIGLEISHEAIKHARATYPKNNLTFIQGDCAALPFEASTFDVVLSFETLEHIENQNLFLTEIRRVLKPGGILVISTPDREIYSPAGHKHNEYHVKELDKSEFFSLISSQFSDVVQAHQKATSGSIILNINGTSPDLEIFYRANNRSISSGQNIQRAVYLLAIASNSSVPAVTWGLYENDKFTHELRANLWAEIGRSRKLEDDLKTASDRIASLEHEVRQLGLRGLIVSQQEDPRPQLAEQSTFDNQIGLRRNNLHLLAQADQTRLSAYRVEEIRRNLRLEEGIASAHNISVLEKLTREEREDFARQSGTMVLYIGDEVSKVQFAEERAALYAVPFGFELSALNGLNIGCGNRLVSRFIQPVDIRRDQIAGGSSSGMHHALTNDAILALPDSLPFSNNSVDFVLALHMLERAEEPVVVINHWLDVLKPGGGIGLILPDWRYTWDSRNDDAPFSHKWNSTPELLVKLHDKYWSNRSSIEAVKSYDYRISFDFVIRKHGVFTPFSAPDINNIRSGKKRNSLGLFLHSD